MLASGAGLDDWIDGLVRDAGGDATLVEVAPEADLRPGALGEGGPVDPHFWNDPTLAAKAVMKIDTALADVDPAGAGVFDANTRRYQRTLHGLDRELSRELAAVPVARRKMVTDHDAFGYLAARYRIDVVGAAIIRRRRRRPSRTRRTPRGSSTRSGPRESARSSPRSRSTRSSCARSRASPVQRCLPTSTATRSARRARTRRRTWE